MCEPGPEGINPVTCNGGDLNRLSVRGYFTFNSIEANAIPSVKLVHKVWEREHILYGVGDKCAVIGAPFIGLMVAIRFDIVATPSGIGREVMVLWNRDCLRKMPDAPHLLGVGARHSRDPVPVRLR
jgi:hypothetical protein